MTLFCIMLRDSQSHCQSDCVLISERAKVTNFLPMTKECLHEVRFAVLRQALEGGIATKFEKNVSLLLTIQPRSTRIKPEDTSI